MDLGLKDKVALVTAASKGLGLAVASGLAAEGARVAISARSEDLLSAAATELGAADQVAAFPADLTDPGAVESMADAVLDRFGHVDILVCNTGGPRTMSFMETTTEDWEDALQMMFFPAIQLCRRVIPGMREAGGGRIVFMTSTWVKQPRDRGTLSTVVRSAISGLSKHLANELAEDNILVNQVMPGPAWTGRAEEIVGGLAERRGVTVDVVKAEIMEELPLRRYGSPEEVAAAIIFLASEQAAYITGTALQVDGGQIKATL